MTICTAVAMMLTAWLCYKSCMPHRETACLAFLAAIVQHPALKELESYSAEPTEHLAQFEACGAGEAARGWG